MKRQTAPASGKTVKVDITTLDERNGRRLFPSEKPNVLIQELLPVANGSPGVNSAGKQQPVRESLVLRNELSSYLFEYLEGFHIPTHFVKRYSETAMMVKPAEWLPLNVHVVNTGMEGEALRRLGAAKGQEIDFPIIEHYYTNGNPEPAWVNEYHLYALSILTPEEFKQINRLATKANAVLRSICDRRKLQLASVRFEFGRSNDRLLLVGELSQVTCRFTSEARGAGKQERNGEPLPVHDLVKLLLLKA
jgi:phosphoribosylaminoimidazole-succinocarboxamide synthase